MTMTAYQTPAPLERYLRRATLGLPPAKREEVWNELEEHVLCRAERLEFMGLSPDAALAQALRELGPPLRVSAAMNGVHNMPKMIAFGVVGMLAISAGLYAAAQTPSVKVPVQTSAPKMECVKADATQPDLPLLVKFKSDGLNCYQDDSKTTEGVYMSLTEVRKNFEKLGMKTNQSAESGAVDFFYLGRHVAVLYPAYKRDGETYLDVADLFSGAMGGFPIPITLHGNQQPVFQVGTVGSWALENAGGNPGQAVYKTLSQGAGFYLYDFTKQGQRWSLEYQEPDSKSLRNIPTDLKPGEVVAAYQWVSSKPKTTATGVAFQSNGVTVETATVDEQGIVKLHLPYDAQFAPTPPTEPGNDVFLVKLTNTPLGNLKSGIFLPK